MDVISKEQLKEMESVSAVNMINDMDVEEEEEEMEVESQEHGEPKNTDSHSVKIISFCFNCWCAEFNISVKYL